MRMATWNPWREWEQLQSAVSRAFAPGSRPEWRSEKDPPVNLWRNENGLLLTAELPGLSLDSFDITVSPDAITISGRRPTRTLGEGESWNRKERADVPFQRTIELPVAVNPASAEAVYEKGVLTVTLQRPTEHRSTRVSVRGN